MRNLSHELTISFVLTIISSVLFYFLFKDWQQSTVAGLILGLYSFIFSLYNLVIKENKKALELSKELSEKYISLLGVTDISSNNWLQEILNRMVAIEKSTERHKGFLNFTRREIGKAIDVAEGILKGKKIDYSGWEAEIERQLWLKDIVRDSRRYVRAITSYDPVYWDNFWHKRGFSDEYVKINIEAAKNGVYVERIFVLPDVILKGQDLDGCDKVKEIVMPMLNKQNIKIYFASAEEISKDLPQYKTVNCLVADDLFVGFSIDFSDKSKSSGYISMALLDEVEKIKNIFNCLLVESSSAEEYEFLKKVN